jgi:aromatic ring-opening dioxygenase catalytic subunit (LigB family)
MTHTTLPTYYLTHGGGPWPYMKAEMGGLWDELEKALIDVPRQVGNGVKAILAVTAHWESPQFMISSAAKPGMLYDYFGFPPHTYTVQYPAPGSPTLAQRVQGLLNAGGHAAELDDERGLDHGTFCMLAPMYPKADVPVVQLSLRADFSPAAHITAGKLLAPLREEGVLILGSGSSYHNLRQFNASAAVPSRQFDDWLQHTLIKLTSTEREQALLHWDKAPAARVAHAREEHLLPLMVAAGAAHDDMASCVYYQNNLLGGITMSSFRFGDAINN